MRGKNRYIISGKSKIELMKNNYQLVINPFCFNKFAQHKTLYRLIRNKCESDLTLYY